MALSAYVEMAFLIHNRTRKKRCDKVFSGFKITFVRNPKNSLTLKSLVLCLIYSLKNKFVAWQEKYGRV